MSNWVRLWEDMPNDPKWRVIAKRAKRPIAEVLAVFVHMMTNAGQAANRGALEGWNDEDVGAALDMEPCDVAAIREAMQGKTLDGDKLSGWEKRQPKREDGGAERAKAWRENKKADRTQPNATERTETPREDTDTDTDEMQPNATEPTLTSTPTSTSWRDSTGLDGTRTGLERDSDGTRTGLAFVCVNPRECDIPSLAL